MNANAHLFASAPSANTIKETHTSFFLFRPFCGLSGLSLAVRETRPNCWLIGWQRLGAVMSRRGDTSTSSCPASFCSRSCLSVASSIHWTCLYSLYWTELFPLQDCTYVQHKRDTLWRGAMVAESFCPLFIILTCIFLLFDLQASLSAERVLGAFHHLYCLLWKTLLQTRLFRTHLFQVSSIASSCGYWPLAVADVNCLLVYHCFNMDYLS